MLGLEQKLGFRLVIYADDLVILCKRGKAEEALAYLHAIMRKLKLEVSAGEDADLQDAGRDVRLLRLYVWACLFSENWSGPFGLLAVEEKHQAHGGENPCADRTLKELARNRRAD